MHYVLQVNNDNGVRSYFFETPQAAVSAAGDHGFFSESEKERGLALLTSGRRWIVVSSAGSFEIRPTRKHAMMTKKWDYKVETHREVEPHPLGVQNRPPRVPVVTDDGRVRSVPIDVDDLAVFDCDFENMAALIDSIRSYGWQGFTDYSCELVYDYGCEGGRPVAQARLWRRATEEEVAAHKEHVRAKAEEIARERRRMMEAELERLKRELGEK